MKVKLKIQGQMVDLRATGKQVPNEVVGKAMEQPCKVMAGLAKSNAPVQTGNLQRAISYKVSLDHLAKGVVIGIVGVRRRAPGRPTKYAHLVEFGHATSRAFRKRAKTNAKFVPPRPFMRPAFEQFRGQGASVLGAGITDTLSTTLRAKVGGKKINVEV